MFAIFDVKAPDVPKADEALKDDLVSRQSITIKDGVAYGASGKVVIIEGSDAGIAKAAEIVKANNGRESPKAEIIYKQIKDEESAAEGGVGFVFG